MIPRLILLMVLSAKVWAESDPRHILVFSTVSDGTVKGVAKAPPPPTRDHPAYYALMSGGYHIEGSGERGDDPEKVKMEDIAGPLERALARENYLPVPNDKTADLLLVVHWGYFNAAQTRIDGSMEFETDFHNRQALALVGGGRAQVESSELNDAYSRAKESRYMIVVTAYDYALAKQKQKRRYWQTCLSAPTGGTTLQDSIFPLVTMGAPYFGRDTGIAKEFDWDRAKVSVGTPEVVPMPAGTQLSRDPKK